VSCSVLGKPRVYRKPVGTKMIKVDEAVHARLVELAAEAGTTIGGYVAMLVEGKRTRAERMAAAQQTQDYMREHFGYVLTPEEFEKAKAWWEGLKAMEQEARQARRASA
jgi:hypothetical protein